MMYGTIRHRFQAVSALLVVLFASACALTAVFVERQGVAADRAQRASQIEREVGTIERAFGEARLCEKRILLLNQTEAQRDLAQSLQKASEKAEHLELAPFDSQLAPGVTKSRRLLANYEDTLNHLIQIKTEAKLNQTTMDSNARSLASAIQMSADPALINALYTTESFRRDYVGSHRRSEFDAIKVMLDAIALQAARHPSIEDRLKDHIHKYHDYLARDLAMHERMETDSRSFAQTGLELTDCLAEISGNAHQISETQMAATAASRTALVRSIFVASGVELVLLIGIITAFARNIVNPIRDLAGVAARVHAGDFRSRCAVRGNDEIAQLGHAFNNMLSTIQENNTRLLAYQGDLENKVRQVAASEAKFRSVIESARDTMVRVNPDLTAEFLNPVCSQITGYSREELPTVELHSLIHPDDRPRYQDLIAAILDGKPPTAATELRVRHKDGRWISLETTMSPIIDGSTPPAMLGILRDITERKEAEREAERLHQELRETSRRAGMAEVATGVLHNVGNVLNSVNVSVALVSEKTREMAAVGLQRVADMLLSHADNYQHYLTEDPKGKLLPVYLKTFSTALEADRGLIQTEVARLTKSVEHIKEAINMQQRYAGISSVVERMSLANLVEDAIAMDIHSLSQHEIQIERSFEPLPLMKVDYHKVFQILMNLISNAKYAMKTGATRPKQMRFEIARTDHDTVVIRVQDNGIGIAPEVMPKLFGHGFTTHQDGHGFGLHTSILAARELGGNLTAVSAGIDCGATFMLELPWQPDGTHAPARSERPGSPAATDHHAPPHSPAPDRPADLTLQEVRHE